MSNNESNTQKEQSDKLARRRRVQRMKSMIIVTIISIIVILFTLCIGLMVKITKIEKKVNELVKNSSLVQLEDEKTSSIAYAAEMEKDELSEETMKTEESVNVQPEKKKKEKPTIEEKLDKGTEKRKVYLTFDDGPSKYSDELLDTLKTNNVKATFFVIGRTDKHSLSIYKRIVNEGHTLAMHSYSHQYSKIYNSIEAFDKDLNKLSDLLYKTTGIRPDTFRFPGGSSNLVSTIPMTEFIRYLNERKIAYYDWNVINGDATGKVLTEKQMIQNVMSGVRQNNNSIVLMHDTVSKDTTVKSITALVKKLKKEGYIILPITKYTKTVQHIKADSVD
ncbi:MAG: polysaccharide deacetylase family protein [Acetivibrio sp.]